MHLRSFLSGAWVWGNGEPAVLLNPATEEPLADTSTGGLDFAAALDFARRKGGTALRAWSFAQRGEALDKIAKIIHQNRDALIDLSITNGGNTRSDAKFDIDGASGTLSYYASVGRKLGERPFLADGEPLQLGRSPRFAGVHVLVPRHGVAVHVNAFNFPAWGFAEKAAVALLAGVPVVTKPATSTALVAHRIVDLCVQAAVLPEGALSLVCGGIGDLLGHLCGQDLLAFTGSGATATALRSHPRLAAASVRLNVEADSLNAAVLGPDVTAGSETYALFLSSVVRDMTQKAGQKCTAIRRIFVPRSLLGAVEEDLVLQLARVKVGNPASEDVNMGPLSTASQLRDVRAGVDRLRQHTRTAIAESDLALVGAPSGKGFFHAPQLLVTERPVEAIAVHSHEVFGPVATLMPYERESEVALLVRLGDGGLVSSIFSDQHSFTEQLVLDIAPFHGRVLIGCEKVAEHATAPGMVLPQLVHGGPGRAGGGEELGGQRGLAFYMQRTAIQGSRSFLEAAFGGKSITEGG